VYALGSGTDPDSNPLTAYAHENSLLYAGVPVLYNYSEAKTERFYALGGIFVEAIAASSEVLEPVPEGSHVYVNVRHQKSRANYGALNEWSSSATSPLSTMQIQPFFETIANKTECAGGVLSRIMNEEWLWSPHDVNSHNVPITRALPVGDAGVYDDNGHLPLLRRGISKMVIFDNWAHQAEDNIDSQMWYTKAAFGQRVFAQNRTTKPGAPNAWMPEHFLTVFEPSEFEGLWKRIKTLKDANKPVVVRDNFTVVDNRHFGVKGGWQVEIVFVIAHQIDEWRNALPEQTRLNLPTYFPQMNSNELLDQFHLSALSQYASWLTRHAVVNEIRGMLGGRAPTQSSIFV